MRRGCRIVSFGDRPRDPFAFREIARASSRRLLALPGCFHNTIAEVQHLLDHSSRGSASSQPSRARPRRAAQRSGAWRAQPGDQPAAASRRALRSTAAFTLSSNRHRTGRASVRYTRPRDLQAPFNPPRALAPGSRVHVHRRMLRTFHFWIPLQAVTSDNGCMQFIPGSHANGLLEHSARQNGHVRRARVSDTRGALACPLDVGGVTIHSPLTLHYTGPNHTAQVRRAWILHFGPWGRLAKWIRHRFDKVRARRCCRTGSHHYISWVADCSRSDHTDANSAVDAHGLAASMGSHPATIAGSSSQGLHVAHLGRSARTGVVMSPRSRGVRPDGTRGTGAEVCEAPRELRVPRVAS